MAERKANWSRSSSHGHHGPLTLQLQPGSSRPATHSRPSSKVDPLRAIGPPCFRPSAFRCKNVFS
eukprot:366017-Chlamydomonas_euryale.AAC.16